MIDLAPLLSAQCSETDASPPADNVQLDEIISLADHNQLAEAATAAQTAWLAGTRDVRILGFFLAGAYVQDGLRALPALLRALGHVLGPPWVTLSPAQNRERYADGALRWLFTSIMSQLRFHQHAGKESWQTTLQDWASLPQGDVLSLLETTASAVEQVTSLPGAKSSALSLLSLLKRLPSGNPMAAGKPSPKEGTETAEADRGESGRSSGDGSSDDPAAATATAMTGGVTVPTLSVPLSPPMQKLLRKLDAFGRLVNLGKFRHAAIVYRDIQASLTGFDPRQYFPSLFGDYYGHVVTHADKITKHIGEDKGFLADALRELYQTDLELFVSSKG